MQAHMPMPATKLMVVREAMRYVSTHPFSPWEAIITVKTFNVNGNFPGGFEP
jgi:hypothetical protein